MNENIKRFVEISVMQVSHKDGPHILLHNLVQKISSNDAKYFLHLGFLHAAG